VQGPYLRALDLRKPSQGTVTAEKPRAKYEREWDARQGEGTKMSRDQLQKTEGKREDWCEPRTDGCNKPAACGPRRRRHTRRRAVPLGLEKEIKLRARLDRRIIAFIGWRRRAEGGEEMRKGENRKHGMVWTYVAG